MLDDIFGHRLGTVFEQGMVDSSDDADFQMKLDSTLEKWRNLDVCSPADMEGRLSLILRSQQSSCHMPHYATPYPDRVWSGKPTQDLYDKCQQQH